jgi:glycosyltransferase involved in cell wall biosynthesis
MKYTDIFVLPSDVETFGVVVIEAMAMGLPVVATASGGPEDIITKETGVIVERNSNSLAKGIMGVIANYGNYNKEIIRSYILNNFSGKIISDQYIEIYYHLTSNQLKHI